MAKRKRDRKQSQKDVQTGEVCDGCLFVHSLDYAVRFWIDRIKEDGGPNAELREVADDHWHLLGERCFQMFAGTDEALDLFDRLAFVLALQAFDSRGVKAFGYHWTAKPRKRQQRQRTKGK